ncbi:MAG: flagellar hook-basal body complex protein [Rhodospirillales bacterium]|nr:flagellar hook-basal body complex protein [Rhodospirillales bacterium]
MPVYSAFAPSILGLQSQAQSLGTISQNIANATTGGYKRTETRFQTVLSESLRNQSDLGGSRPIDVQMIDNQGVVLTTTRDLDLAIVGDGFFVVSTAITGGETFYTRDGSFEIKVGAPVTSGTTTTTPGYLVDKNGYYLMGWAPNATTGVFPTSGAVQALRVDADNFANTFTATTKVDLGVNLPASTTLIPGTRRVDTVTFAGTIEAGDVYSITVGGATYSYTTTGGEANINAVRDNLISQINAAAGAPVTASIGGTGVVQLSAKTIGTAFTATASATNGGATADNTATPATVTANVTAAAAHATAVSNADSGSIPNGYHSYSISVIDSAGNRQPVRLNFTRSDENTWQVSATHSRTPTAQVDTITLAGAVEPGDSYSVTVGGTTYTYTRSGATTTIDTARDALVSQINANTNSTVTAAAGGTGVLTLTAKTAGTAFTASVSATNVTSTADNTANGVNITAAAPGVAQVDDVTIAGTIEAGDSYSITVNGTVFTYTLTGSESGINAVRDALIASINADAALPVTASANGAGVIRLTADAVNTPFTRTQSATNIGGGAANTASRTTTTANVTNTTTTASTTLTFSGKGALSSPTSPISYSLTFNGGTTGSFTLDLSTTTQFDTGFTALSQNSDGFEKSNLGGISWDQDGFLVGTFSNGNSRRLYKLPLAYFTSPNNLTMRNGMVFEENEASGTPRIEDPNTNGKALFAAGAVESSNVEIADEFSRMIQTQAVYNANALAFRTNDELTVTIRDLVRA